jgi:hypothetical protein
MILEKVFACDDDKLLMLLLTRYWNKIDEHDRAPYKQFYNI